MTLVTQFARATKNPRFWEGCEDSSKLGRIFQMLSIGLFRISRKAIWTYRETDCGGGQGLHSGNSIRLLRGRSRPDRAIPHIYCPRPFESPLKRETITFVARQRVFFLTFEKRNRGHKGTIPPLTMARGITNSGRTGGCFRVDSSWSHLNCRITQATPAHSGPRTPLPPRGVD